MHLDRLCELEYLLVHREGPGGKFVYELVYDGDGSLAPHLSGLIDTTTIQKSRGLEAKSRGGEAEVAGRLRGDSGPVAGGCGSAKSLESAVATGTCQPSDASSTKTHVSKEKGGVLPYSQVVPMAAAAGK